MLMPLPGSAPIHPRWEEHHRPVAAGQCTATCDIVRPPGGPVYNPETRKSTRTPGPTIYSGACRVQVMSRQTATQLEFGGDQITRGQYRVSLPYGDADVATDDLISITTSSDPLLVAAGRRLRVTEVAYGSLLWQRDLTCVLDD